MGAKDLNQRIDAKRIEQGIITLDDIQFEERLLEAARTTRVTKGGKRFSFSALVVIGDRRGYVGFGLGKAREVPLSIAKAIEDAKKKTIKVPIVNGTIPHDVVGEYGSARIIIFPARRGTGVIAGGAAKPIFELAGYTDVLTKIVGSSNSHNVVRAVFDALLKLKDLDTVAKVKGVAPEDLRQRYNIYAR